jgi:hypothetical protein
LNAADYLLPQEKRRMFLLGVLRPGRSLEIDSFTRFFGCVEALLECFKMAGPSLAKVLLDDSSTLVLDELSRRQEKNKMPWCSSTIDAHRKAWAALGVRWNSVAARAIESDRSSPWYDTLCAREKDALAYSQRVNGLERLRPTDLRGHAKLSLYDLGASIQQPMYGKYNDGRLTACIVLPRGKIWLSLRGDSSLVAEGRNTHRLMLGREALTCVGWAMRLRVLSSPRC